MLAGVVWVSRVLAAVLVCLLIGGAIVPVAGGSSSTTTPATDPGSIDPGAKLTGVVGVQEAEVDGAVRERAFQIAFAAAESNASKAETVARTAGTLSEQLDRLEGRQAQLRSARSNGSLSEDQFYARMAIIGSKLATVRRLANRTAAANRALPSAAVQAAGMERGTIPALQRRAANLSTPAVAAMSRSVAGNRAGRPIGNATGPPGRSAAPAVPGKNKTNRSKGPPDGDRSRSNRSQGAAAHPPDLYSGVAAQVAVAPRTGPVAGAVFGAASPAARTYAVPDYKHQYPRPNVVGNPAARRTQDEQRPLFEVDVTDEGDARITLQLAFDLTTDADTQSFQTLKEDEEAREDVSTRFRDRLQSIANSSEQRVDRSMTVHNPGINMSTSADGTTGYVAISVDWDGLAGLASDPAHLVLTEPFASGFTPSRQFTVRITAPDRFRVTSITPEPESQDNASATWAAGTTLNGFQLVFSPGTSTPLPEGMLEDFEPRSPTDGSSNGAGPSSSALIVGGALLGSSVAGAWLLWRRRQAENATDQPEEG